MAVTTMRLCGRTQSEQPITAQLIHSARINMNRTNEYWALESVAVKVEEVVRAAEVILEAVAVPNRQPKDLTGKEIEAWTVQNELETLAEDLSIIISVVTVDIKSRLPSDGIVKLEDRAINLDNLTSHMHLQKDCMIAYAKEYGSFIKPSNLKEENNGNNDNNDI